MADTLELMRPEAGPAPAPPPQAISAEDGRWELALAALGLLALFIPTYLDLARGTWTDPHEAHGPFVLAIAVGAAVARWKQFLAVRDSAPIVGTLTLVFGLLLYALGRSQEFLVIETGSVIPVVAGVLLVLKGWQGLRILWFPVVFLAFTIVWPGWVIDKLTIPLKQAASDFTVSVLSHFGYPIAATGVKIFVGKYDLLVADACSGLNTIISLLSVGVLYLYMARRNNPYWNAAIIIAMPFIAFAANVLRVMGLTLITYHFGSRAGESFLHDFTGLFLFGVALGLVFLLDSVIERGGRLVHALRGRTNEAK
jgi:exosortase B